MATQSLTDLRSEVQQLVISGDAKRLREKANLTRAEVGKRLKVDPATVYRYEVGLRLPRARNLVEYHKFLTRLLAQEKR